MNWFDIYTFTMSCISILTLWMMGDKNKYAPWVGLLSQLTWIFYVCYTKQWGLMLGVVAYTVVHLRNILKWR
jgi:hypothetical protein